MKTKVYLVRHCESEGNICRRNHAQFDNVPTRKGLLQSEALADRFDTIPLDAIYSSDQYRAIVTAQPVAERKGLKIQLRRLLREYTIGNWEGTSIGDIARDYPELWAEWVRTPWAHHIPSCDSFEAVALKGYKAIMDIVHENRGKSVMVMSHLTTIGCAFTRLLDLPMDEYKNFPGGDNTAVSLIEIDDNDKAQVIYLGDISHLPPELKRTNYTGRTRENNFAYDPITDANLETYISMYSTWAGCNGRPADRESALKALNESLSLSPKGAMIADLMGRSSGLFMVREDPRLPDDHGLLDVLYMVEDITEPGMAAQIFGEGLDQMRRRGKRYLVLKGGEDRYTRFFLERFIFEAMPKLEGYFRMRITVPGIEGPIY